MQFSLPFRMLHIASWDYFYTFTVVVSYNTPTLPQYPSSFSPSQVVKLDLQHNELTQIPHCLLELPSPSELNLSHKRLSDMPDVPEWPSCLAVLNLSHNSLQNMPLNVMAPSICTLDISHNHGL